MNFDHIEGLEVVVNDVEYLSSSESLEGLSHSFIYFISIINHSKEIVQILGRKWIIEEQDKSKIVVEGDGVVGETPVLTPGEDFSYNSSVSSYTKAQVKGSFYGVAENGSRIRIEIPVFDLIPPSEV